MQHIGHEMRITPADIPVRHGHIELPGQRLHYVEHGEGAPVVLLHGFPDTWWSWRYQIEPLVNAGYRVIAPDLRGYGDSPSLGPFDVDTIAGDVVALMEALGVSAPMRLVGHDWGGAVAWHLAGTRPQHLHSLAILSCPHPVILRRALLRKPKVKQLLKSWYMLFFQLPWLPERMLTRDNGSTITRMIRGASLDKTRFTAEELAPIREAVLQPGRAHSMLEWYRTAFRVAPARTKPIERPTLLVWPMDDAALDAEVLLPGHEQFATHLKVLKVAQCGHWVQAEKPGVVNAELLRHFAQ